MLEDEQDMQMKQVRKNSIEEVDSSVILKGQEDVHPDEERARTNDDKFLARPILEATIRPCLKGKREQRKALTVGRS